MRELEALQMLVKVARASATDDAKLALAVAFVNDKIIEAVDYGETTFALGREVLTPG